MDEQQARTTEAMMTVSRTLTAIVARTLHDVAEQITVPQLRVLVLLDTRGPMNLTTIAQHLDVNPSNASRTCDQLVTTGRVLRAPDPQDGRSTVLALTADGARFVAELMSSRRRLVDDVVSRMGPADRRALERGLEAFMTAVEAAPAEETIGLADGRIIPWLM
ncbi:MarR family winged helix-turn-helix transcriptional regulator [Auraticoccus monumenti]|uniref:DNA-binding transcriptional regulator, MarR family n=1 Tax=Auraticoccus monumenti TaxID=675864 RepID=A0A1G7CF27_9ACTN|nr:MarR family transcriptional regulator [Auraticoccus monumenti]SDE37025.1 DNA-binding transcriptional regulator, MarR family [Auraticoccus monumenti]